MQKRTILSSMLLMLLEYLSLIIRSVLKMVHHIKMGTVQNVELLLAILLS